MGAPTGSKGQQPPNMQGGQSPYPPQGGQQAQPRQQQYASPNMQALNMAQGWGGGWSQQPPNGGYQGGSPMQFGGGWWGPQQNVPQMQPWGAQTGGNMGSPNMPPGYQGGPGQNVPQGGAQTGGNMAPPVPAPPQTIDFAAGFDPSKSAWGAAGKNAYMANKANEFFRNNASGEALYNQWKQIHSENPLAARAFRHSVMGMGGGQNDFEQQLLQREFGGDTAKWNEYRNAAHSAGQEGLEGGFDLVTGKWDPMNANHQAYQVQGWNPASMARTGAAPSGPWDAYAQLGSENNPLVAPSSPTGQPTAIGATPVGAQNVAAIPPGNLPWNKSAPPPAMRAQRDSRWRGLQSGGKPAWRGQPNPLADMAITN